ncbi:MAG: DUF1214 domain-containing protein [Planctomycetota bacterium]|nr:DUF1214 domain-containing protein [Planctomycetota bacterium]
MRQLLKASLLPLLLFSCATQQSSVEAFLVDDGGEVVTAATYPTHETSRQILIAQETSGVNQLDHRRKLVPTDEQTVVRLNRDTYYSLGVVNVSGGATITIPEVPEGTYVSVQGVTEDHRIQAMTYGPGTFDLTTHTGTHLYLVVRLDSTLSPEEAHRIQDGILIEAASSMDFTADPIDRASFEQVETELRAMLPAIAKRDGVTATRGMFTDPRDDSDALYSDEKYQTGAAGGWGGAQWVDNIYEMSGDYPTGEGFAATFEDPGNDAFWSFTVYDKKGFMFDDVGSLNSDTATPNADGTFTIRFGCGPDAVNNIPTDNPTGSFNLIVRHYKPSERVRDEGYRLIPSVKPTDG